MKTNTNRRQTTLSIANSRWLTYTTAATATALGGAMSAEASVVVVNVNQTISANPANGSSFVAAEFPLPAGNDFILNNLRSSSGIGAGGIGMQGGAEFIGKSFASGGSYSNVFAYPSKLALGANIAGGPFAPKAFGTLAFGTYGNPNSKWIQAGEGYIGFKFTDAAGTEYGWIDLSTNGAAAGEALTLKSYAYTTAGEEITAGQAAVPEPGSLALLAAGGAGLLAWRQRRARSAALPG